MCDFSGGSSVLIMKEVDGARGAGHSRSSADGSAHWARAHREAGEGNQWAISMTPLRSQAALQLVTLRAPKD
jgi:hypothetical protein